MKIYNSKLSKLSELSSDLSSDFSSTVCTTKKLYESENVENIKRKDWIELFHILLQKNQELKILMQNLGLSDPVTIERIKKETETAKEASNRWTGMALYLNLIFLRLEYTYRYYT